MLLLEHTDFYKQVEFHAQAMFAFELGLDDWQKPSGDTPLEDWRVCLHCESSNNGALRIEKNDGQAHSLAPLHCANITCGTVNGVNLSNLMENIFDILLEKGI